MQKLLEFNDAMQKLFLLIEVSVVDITEESNAEAVPSSFKVPQRCFLSAVAAAVAAVADAYIPHRSTVSDF